MSGYVPGEQPAGGGGRLVKLNTNEASFPPSPRVVEAVRGVTADALRRYPPPRSDAFRQAAARRHGVDVDRVLAGNGSDDVLTMIVRTFVPPGGTVAAPWPTYSLYPTLCQIQGATFTPVPWRDGWRLPADALVNAAADAVFLANPNAPSGTVVPADELADLADRLSPRPLLIDEAYADYAQGDCVSLVAGHANVIVSRSLSKGFALAGLRVGYATARPEVVAAMDKVRDSYNLDAVAQAAGAAALGDLAYYEPLWRDVRRERERLTDGLRELGFDVPDSHGNFVLARRDDAADLFVKLRDRGVLVRRWDAPGLADCLRITVGTTGENAAVLDALGRSASR